LTKRKALMLAALTLWPIVYMISFMGLMAYLTIFSQSEMPGFFGLLVVVHLITMLEIFALLFVYIVHLYRMSGVPADKKALWTVVLLFCNVLAMPVYWWLYIWMPLNEQA
jgi:hypothetical protein